MKTKKTSLLRALFNLKQITDFSLPSHYSSANRMNSMGIALEYFVKDIFCGTLGIKDIHEKDKEYPKYLSYIGNANNPPDFIIRKDDAVEVKKIESQTSGLALNSSYPKDKLYSDNPLITDACRKCEEWKIKDIVYAVGVVSKGLIKRLWFVYGDCYSADKEVYEKTRKKVIDGVNATGDIEFSKTKELGRVNRVDPLGITYLRVRGMWGIENPISVFNYLKGKGTEPMVVSIMKLEKYNSFPEQDRLNLEKDGLVSDVKVKDPNNPVKFFDGKLIKF